MARKRKLGIDEQYGFNDTDELDLIGEGEDSSNEEADNVEETQELSFSDVSYNRLNDLSDTDEWN